MARQTGLINRVCIGSGQLTRLLLTEPVLSNSKDLAFEEKFSDVVGLYLKPPIPRWVLCCDEKSQR